MHDLDFMPVFIHGEVKRITGYNANDFISGSLKWKDIVHPDDLHGYPGDMHENLKMVPNFSDGREYRIICKDGKIHWVNNFIKNICDDLGKPIRIQEIINDITERKNMEQKIKEKSKELDLFSTMTVNYENQIIELKKKVNSLCKALGEAPKYDLSFIKNGKNKRPE